MEIREISNLENNCNRSVKRRWVSNDKTLDTTLWHIVSRIFSGYCVEKISALSPEITVESTVMRAFHSDPADQIIEATSRILGLPQVTSHNKILQFLGLVLVDRN